MKTYYKVVRRQNSRLYSVNPSSWVVKYTPNKWVTPKIPHSKLFVFDSLEEAKHMQRNNPSGNEIWECKISNPKKMRKIAFWMLPTIFTTFWKLNKQKKSIAAHNAMRPLLGTVTCDKVKLIKKVVIE